MSLRLVMLVAPASDPAPAAFAPTDPLLHLGAQSRFWAPAVDLAGEIGVILDLHPIASFGWRPRLAFGVGPVGPRGLVALHARLMPLSFEVEPVFVLRAGVDLAGLSVNADWAGLVGASFEAAVRFCEGHLEVGVGVDFLALPAAPTGPDFVAPIALFASAIY